MKLGIHESFVDRAEIAELLRVNTSKSSDERTNLKRDIGRMKEGQQDIYYITGESIAVVFPSSFRENLREEGYEVLYMSDPVDEYAVLAEIAELHDDYKKFYEQFVKYMKLGIRENSVDGVEIDEVLRSNTSKPGDERINFKEYVDRMKGRAK